MNEIGLQDLIYQVKRELLAPNPAQRAKDPDPLFFVDKVEIEVTVKVQKEGNGSIKISVLNIAELNAGGSALKEHGHIIRVSLSPLLSKGSILTDLMRDPDIAKRIQDQQRAMLKGDVPLAGTPE